MVKLSLSKRCSRRRRRRQDDATPAAGKEEISVSYFRLFSLASRNDYYALACGIVAALCNGALMPVFSLLFGNFASASAGGLDGFMDRIVTITWQMCILAGVALITAAIFNTCFTYFSENQASRLRVKYLQAVIGQDIA
ncbi:(ABC) transporter, partial [Perkinsus olseni]